MTIGRLDSQPGSIGPPADWPMAPETWWKMRAIILDWLQSGDDEPEPDEPGKDTSSPVQEATSGFSPN